MSQDLLASLEYIEKEKGITKEVLLDALRHALISACRKGSPEKGDAFDVQIDPKTFRITMFLDGKEIHDPRFGRIAAQTAKQVIIALSPRPSSWILERPKVFCPRVNNRRLTVSVREMWCARM